MLRALRVILQGLVLAAAILWALCAIGGAILFMIWLVAHVNELQMIIQCST